MRRALILVIAAFALLVTPARADTTTVAINGGIPTPNPAIVTVGDSVVWHNNDNATHTIKSELGAIVVLAGSNSPPVEIDADLSYVIDVDSNGPFTIKANPPATTSSTTTSTTTTTRPTTTSSSTTTTTSSTTTSTSSTTTTSTTLFSSGSVGVTQPSDGGGGGSSALPLIVGGILLVAGLAGGAFYLWNRSGQPYVDDGPDWTQEPPTMQGPTI